MRTGLGARSDLDRLPAEPVDAFARPFARFLRIEAVGGGVLLLFTIAAVVLANSAWARLFLAVWETRLELRVGDWTSGRSVREWINDGLMTLFFFVVALELKRELVLGELRSPRMAALAIAGALGGMLVPAGLYLAFEWGRPGQHGWGTVMATDTAFVIGCLALIGARLPQSLRVFMLSMAILDDIGAILVVAVGYGDALSWAALGVAASGIGLVRAMAVLGVRSVALYCIAGGLIWLAVDASGIHATLSGVILGLLTPARRWVSDERLYAILGRVVAHPSGDRGSADTRDRESLVRAEIAARETLAPVERLEMALHPWVGFVVMPLFAFANAGVVISTEDFANPVTLAVFVGLAAGKPIGIVAFSWLAVRTGVAIRPQDLRWGLLAAGSLLAGIGFTMALFIANLAFDSSLIGAAKLGIFLASIVSAIAGVALLAYLSRRTAVPGVA